MYSQESFTSDLPPLARCQFLKFSQPPKTVPLNGTKHKIQEPAIKLYIQTKTGSHCGFCPNSLNYVQPMGTSKPTIITIIANMQHDCRIKHTFPLGTTSTNSVVFIHCKQKYLSNQNTVKMQKYQFQNHNPASIGTELKYHNHLMTGDSWKPFLNQASPNEQHVLGDELEGKPMSYKWERQR